MFFPSLRNSHMVLPLQNNVHFPPKNSIYAEHKELHREIQHKGIQLRLGATPSIYGPFHLGNYIVTETIEKKESEKVCGVQGVARIRQAMVTIFQVSLLSNRLDLFLNNLANQVKVKSLVWAGLWTHWSRFRQFYYEI